MARVILLTDFSEEYARRLLRGFVQYSKQHKSWVLCRMPLSYRDLHKMEGVLEWARRWRADGIIAQFYNSDRVSIFKENGIVAIAQDFKSRFAEIPNITGAHHLAGKMGADYFIRKGFKNFAFYGFKNIVWSQERFEGFKGELVRHGMGDKLYEYQNEDFRELWYYQSNPLISCLEALPKPVAMMACDDNNALHITEVCRQRKIKIPEEISLLGVDNDESICTLSDPPLSSLDQTVESGGYEAARLMDKLISNPDAPYEDIVVYPTHVITRQSTDIYAASDKYIVAVLRHIHQHANKKLNIDEITQLVPLSRRLLEERVKDVTGFPIHTYITNFRVNKFAQELIETDRPIIEIVAEQSSLDYKNIARMFKQVKGCTPSEFRLKYSLKE